MILNVNASAVSRHTATLEEISKKALPLAVRATLNTVAFNTKQKTMPAEAADAFEKRRPNFFRANSTVEMARGIEINNMRSIVGFVPKNDKKAHSVQDLEQQEHGGVIPDRSFIALRKARVGKVWNKAVAAKNRMGTITPQIFNSASSNLNGVKNGKEAFTISAIYAQKGGFVLGNTVNHRGNRMLMYINSVHRLENGNTVVNSTPLYAVKKDREVRVKPTGFMEKASIEATKDMEKIFIKNAEKAINDMSYINKAEASRIRKIDRTVKKYGLL